MSPHLSLLGMLMLALVGCGHAGTSIRGTVTYDGQPVQRGVITFTPTDGSGKPEGAKILAGKFEISSIEPGQKQASVVGVFGGDGDPTKPVASDEKIATMIEANQAAEMIPTNAVGNGQAVTIEPGPQEISLELSQPPGN